jgi:hypothetical protein
MIRMNMCEQYVRHISWSVPGMSEPGNQAAAVRPEQNPGPRVDED